MTDNEFLAQMKLHAQNLREEVETLKIIDVDAIVNRAFDQVFGVSNGNKTMHGMPENKTS